MRKVAPLLLLRLALLVAVFGCAVLLVEYENMGDPAFCGAGSGCMAVRRSPYSVIAGVHLPLLGLCALGGLLAFALVARDRANTFFVAAAAAGGALCAVGLIGIMTLKIGAICKWCLLVDLCTIVAFTDFECPFCRKLAPVVHEVQENWGDRAVLVRKMAPLSFHHGAMPAALAYACTPEEQRDEMARRLYAAPDPTLTLDGVQTLARVLHLDEARFARCLEGPAARAQVDADKKLFDELELHGLPYTYVGKRAVAGFNPDALRKLGREAMEDDRPSLPLWGMVGAALAMAAALAVLTLRLAPRDEDALAVAPSA